MDPAATLGLEVTPEELAQPGSTPPAPETPPEESLPPIVVIDDDAVPPPPPTGESAAPAPADDPDWKRSWKEATEKRILGMVAKAVEKYGTPEFEEFFGGLNAREKRIFKPFAEQIDRISQPAKKAELAETWRAHQEMLEEARYSPDVWQQKMADPDWANHWATMLAYKKKYGLPATATAEQLARAYEQEYGAPAAFTYESGAEDLYDEMTDRPEWETFTPEERAQLHPSNFTGDDGQRVRAMERAYGQTAARAEFRTSAEPVTSVLMNTAASRARAAATQAAPVPQTPASPQTMTWSELKAAVRRDGDPRVMAAYAAARDARKARGLPL